MSSPQDSTTDPVPSVVLAAGGSRRMARPKALLTLPSGKRLVEAWVDVLATIGPVTVVIGATTGAIERLIEGRARVVHNPRWESTGALESLLTALETDWRRCIVTPVDVPPPHPDLLALLARQDGPAALGHRGRPGHPILIGSATLTRLLTNPPSDGGLRVLVPAPKVIEAGEAAMKNLNTPEQWRAHYGSTS